MNLNQGPIYRKNNPKRITGFKTRSGFKSKSSSNKSDLTKSSRTVWNKNLPRGQGSTLHSATTSTTHDDSDSRRIITAVTEGRGEAKCEVGIASIDISHPNLILCQISDAQNYMNALTKINILNPSEIIVPTTFLDRYDDSLLDRIRAQFPNVKIVNAPRKSFNKDTGMEMISELCLASSNPICVGIQHRYYALAAASGLITYLQQNHNIYYTSRSINIYYQEVEGCSLIDVSTADRLELVSSTRPAQANRFSTLFSVLNHCFTKIGSRVLRSTILQPPFVISIIEERLDCIAELIKRPEMLLSIQEILQKIPNINQILNITSMVLHNPQISSTKQMNYLLTLNNILDFINPLKDILEECQQTFLCDLREILSKEAVTEVKNLVRNIITSGAHPPKGEDIINQRCFAIKAGINGLLDLVRKTYSERLEDMRNYVQSLGNKYGLRLVLTSNNTKGYHIVFKLTPQERKVMKKCDLPEEFVQVCATNAGFTMKTEELINYSTRLEDILTEIRKISNVMIHKTIVDLKQYIGYFYILCDSIAKLDVIQALSEISLRNNYVRPTFGEFTEITEAKHPLLYCFFSNKFVDNSISISDENNVHIITGPNGSGKSVYIRQVMLLQIMAQVGCYIPAATAIIRPADRMYARVYLEDSLEYGTSTFMLEIKEIKYMMTTLTNKSLVIIDELCRSTSLEEGVALAMAICEKMNDSSAHSFITTHFTALGKLAKMYHNVKTWQMETIAEGANIREMSLKYNYKLIPGVLKLKYYGLYMIQNIWPDTVVEDVYDVLKTIEEENQSRAEYEYETTSNADNAEPLAILREVQSPNSFSNANDSSVSRSRDGSVFEYPPVEVILHTDSNNASLNYSETASDKSCYIRQHMVQEEFRSPYVPNKSLVSYEYSSGKSTTESGSHHSLHVPNTPRISVDRNPRAVDSTRDSETGDGNGEYMQADAESDSSGGVCSENTTEKSPDASQRGFYVPNTPNPSSSSRNSQKDAGNSFSEYSQKEDAEDDEEASEEQIVQGSGISKHDEVNGEDPYQYPYEEYDEETSRAGLTQTSTTNTINDNGDRSQNFDQKCSGEISRYTQVSSSGTRATTRSIVLPEVVSSSTPKTGNVQETSDSSSVQVDPAIEQNDEAESQDSDTSESINYSPLCSPTNAVEKLIDTRHLERSVQSLNLGVHSATAGRTNKDPRIRSISNSSASNLPNINNSKTLSWSNEQPTSSNERKIDDARSSTPFIANSKGNPSTIYSVDDLTSSKLSTSNEYNSGSNIQQVNSSPKDLTASRKSAGDKIQSSSTSSEKKDFDKLPSVIPRRKILKRKRQLSKKDDDTTHFSSSDKAGAKRKAYVPPKKLSRREIEEEFTKQDRIIYQTDPSQQIFTKYLNQLRNRPSIEQVRNCQHLAFVCKTQDGVEVISTTESDRTKLSGYKNKKNKKSSALPVYSQSGQNNIDISIFSDRNAKTFEEFLNSTEKDVRKFNFAFSYKGSSQQAIAESASNKCPAGSSDFKFAFGAATKQALLENSGSLAERNLYSQMSASQASLRPSHHTDQLLLDNPRGLSQQHNMVFSQRRTSQNTLHFVQPQPMSNLAPLETDRCHPPERGLFSQSNTNTSQNTNLNSYYKQHENSVNDIIEKYLKPPAFMQRHQDSESDQLQSVFENCSSVDKLEL